MTAITKYYCNRCGKEVKAKFLVALNLFLHGIYAPESFHSEICKDCSKEFKKWFNKK